MNQLCEQIGYQGANAGSVITDAEHTLKVGHVFDDRLMPKFSILNPEFTFSVPDNQMKTGIFDIMSHMMWTATWALNTLIGMGKK